MFRHLFARVAVLAALPLLFASCGGDPAGPDDLAAGGGATVRGEFSLTSGAVEYRTGRAPDSDDGRGFVLTGSNIRWSADDSALLVDFTVLNDTGNTYPEPVLLTFLQLSPEGTTVNNSDNSETGAGAQVVFEFENDDDMWSPGEVSLVRTVMFGTDEGAAVAFVARIDVGIEPGSAAIGGFVWHDADGDGEIGDDEMGLGDVEVVLGASGGDELARVTTDEDGSYRFDSLPSAVYTVHAVATEGWVATTAEELTIILPDGSAYLAANFGCRREDDGGGGDDEIRVGDLAYAKGEYESEPDRLVAGKLHVCRRDDGGRDRWWIGRLSGPATGVDLEDQLLYVMGTPVFIKGDDDDALTDGDGGCPKPDLDEVEEGQRVRVDPYGRVELEEDEEVLAAKLIRCWNGNGDRAFGRVQAVREIEGEIRGVRVLDTWIEITDDTQIEFCGDDDDCDGDDD